MTLFLGSLEQGLIYGLLAMGIFISFRVLDIPDLTAEGSFTTGVAISAIFTLLNLPWLGLVMAFLGGMIAGIITGLLQTKVRIHPILAGILTMSGLYTINLAIMGARSNVTLIGKDTLFQRLYDTFGASSKDAIQNINIYKWFDSVLSFPPKDILRLALSILVAGFMLILLIKFFKTHLGLCIRATGNNEAMVRSSSINSSAMKIVGLSIANGCISLSGALIAQYQGYADISNGIGILVVGLASVIIGEAFFGRRGVTIGLISAIVGSIIYRIIISLALSTRIFPTYFLKLVSAVIVGIALSIPTIKEDIQSKKSRRENKSNA